MTASFDPARTVFVDVDTQVDFVEPTGALYVPGAEALKPAFARLVAAARAAKRPIVASADAHLPEDPEFEQFPPHCLAGTPGAERVPETRVDEPCLVAADGSRVDEGDGACGTTLVLKETFDMFDNPAAAEVVASSGADTAIVFGVALDYCVRAAALGLRERGYETLLVTDATAPVTAETGAKAEAELRAAGVRFVTTDEVLAAFAAAP